MIGRRHAQQARHVVVAVVAVEPAVIGAQPEHEEAERQRVQPGDRPGDARSLARDRVVGAEDARAQRIDEILLGDEVGLLDKQQPDPGRQSLRERRVSVEDELHAHVLGPCVAGEV